MSLVSTYDRFYSTTLDYKDKLKRSRVLKLEKYINTTESGTQTDDNKLINFIKPRVLETQEHFQDSYELTIEYLSSDVKYTHDHVVVTDATHTDIAIFDTLNVKGNLFVGNLLLTPGTIKFIIKGESDLSIPLCLNGNHGNILFDFQADKSITVGFTIDKIEDRNQGHFLFSNTTDYTMSVDISEFVYFTETDVIFIEPHSVVHMTYYIKNQTVLLRFPEGRSTTFEYSHLDKNDLETVFYNNTNLLNFGDLFDNPNNNSVLKYVDDTPQFVSLESGEYENVTVQPSDNIVFLDTVFANTIKIVSIDPSVSVLYIKPFGAEKNTGEGTIEIEMTENRMLSIVFLNGFLIKNDDYTNLDLGVKTVFWYSHIGNGLTIIRKILDSL
jgi:hypothetical protein